MATHLFELPDKYFDILTWNMILFIQKRPFRVFFQNQILHQIDGFLEAIIQITSLKCPDTTHLPLPMTSSAPELVPLITVLPPSRVHYRLSTSHSTHILTQFVTSRSNRVYKDNHFFLIV